MKKPGKPTKYRLGSGPVIWVDFKKRPSNEQVARDAARRDIVQRANFARFEKKLLEDQQARRHKIHDRIYYTACVVLVVFVVRLCLYLLWRV